MKRATRCLMLMLVGGCLTARPAAQSHPFQMNGWQLHEYDLPKLEEAVRRAPDYGVNFLIFSHDLFRSVEGFLASEDDADPNHPPDWVKELRTGSHFRIIPGWQSDLRRIGNLASKQGIEYYLWVHEFDDVPKRFIKDGRVDMGDPQLFPYLEQRYERLLRAVPGTAGFVLTLHESDLKIFRNSEVSSADDVSERIRRVALFFHDLLSRNNKRLILRNFFYEPSEMEYFKQALSRLPDDLIVMSKDTTHEFHPFYPWDPLHGQVGNKRQITEVDLGIEKAWSKQGAYAQTGFIRRAVQRARSTHQAGLVGRARLFWDRPFADAHEVNLYAFSRFLADPELTVDRVLQDWAVRRYPAKAAPYLVSALRRSEMINHHGRWHLQYWFTKALGAEWADYPYYYGHLLMRSRYKWSQAPADKELEEKLYHPDAETFARLVAEKDEVVAQARAALSDLREADRYLTAEQLVPLQEDFNFLLDAALLQREWVRAYFAMRRFMDHPSEEFRMVMEDALGKLEQCERTPGTTYGLNPATGRRYNIDGFALEMRWRVANRQRALAEDAQLLERIRRTADVAGR